MRKKALGLIGACAVLMPGAATVRAGDGITYALPTCADAWYAENNPNCSPEQRARAAERKREQQAAEAKRKAEQARKDAAIATEVQRLGAHRTDEARRLVEMREAAAAARGKPPVVPPAPKPAPKCEMQTVTKAVGSGYQNSEAIARSTFVSEARRQCGYAVGSPNYSGIPECVTSDQSLYAAMPIGKRPKSSPVKMMTRCDATVTCTERKKVCESTSSGRASAQ